MPSNDRQGGEKMQDKQIVALYWSRDEAAITESQKKYGRYCRYIAYQILHDEEDAKEIENDTYLAAWNTIPPRSPDPLKPYLGMLCRRGALDRYDYKQAEKRGGGQTALPLEELAECIPDDDDGENLCDLIALQDAMNAFLSGLRRRERNVFIRRYFYASPIAEIADEYFMTQSGVKMMLSRLRQRLKAHLEKEGIDV